MYIIGLGSIGLLHSFKSLKVINRNSKFLLPDDKKLIGCLIVALKGPQTGAINELANRIDSNTTIVILSNGCLKIYEDLKKSLNSQNPKYILGAVTHGAYRTADGNVVHSGIGETCLGAMGEYNHDLVKTLMSKWQHLNSKWVGNGITKILEEKLAINCAINPLAALLQCRNGDLLGSVFDGRIRTILQEYQASHYNSEIDTFMKTTESGIASALMERVIKEFTTLYPKQDAPKLLQKALYVIASTKDNHNSMKVDLERGQKTEIGYLNGFLIQNSKTILPFNKMLVDLIEQKSMPKM